MNVTTRVATAADADVLHALIVELAEHHGQREFFRASPKQLQDDGFGEQARFGAVLAEIDGEVAGYASYMWFYSIWLGGEYMNIDDVYVREAARGHGVGLALMGAARDVCQARGLSRIRWEVQPDNSGAIRFYERLGAKMRTKGIWAWDV